MAVNLSQIKDLLLPGLRGVEGKYEQIPAQYDKIFTKHNSSMALERTAVGGWKLDGVGKEDDWHATALVLDLAKVAADNVIRKAAPITTYLLGYAAGSSDADVEEIERLAAKAQALAENWDHPSNAPDPIDVDDEVPDDSVVDHTGDQYE